VYRRCSVTTRKLSAALIAAATVLAVSGCSPGADYPSLFSADRDAPPFPAVHDMPPPRNDTTMNPLQVQQATEDLISERDHLSAGTQAPQQAGKTGNAQAGNVQASNTPPAAKARPAVTKAAVRTSAAGQSATPAPAPVPTQTSGAETQ
jgi:hypothetical protein